MTTTTKIIIASVASFGLAVLLSYFIWCRDDGSNASEFTGLALKRSGTVPLKEAEINIKAYQDKLAYTKLALYPNFKVKGILHDTLAMKNYYKNVYMKFIESRDTLKTGYHWEVGLYPNVCYDRITDKNRLNIYFIPTMVMNSKDSVIEYYSAIKGADSIFYQTKDAKWKFDDSYIFDQGTLFP